MPEKRKIAFFDIDGTVMNNHLTVLLIEYFLLIMSIAENTRRNSKSRKMSWNLLENTTARLSRNIRKNFIR